MSWYIPNFDGECRICGTSPTVNVVGHKQPETDLCGRHFFDDPDMSDYEDWNDTEEGDSR